jgi:hypothetical protein
MPNYGDESSRADMKGKLSLADIAAQVVAAKDEAEEQYKDVREAWDDCWDIVHGIHDPTYEARDDWQATVFVPEAGPAVRKAVSLIRRILLRTGRFFDLEVDEKTEEQYKAQQQSGMMPPPMMGMGQEPESPSMRDGQIAAILYQVEHMIGDKTKEDLSLITMLMEAIASGFTFGLWVVKLWWAPRVRQRIEMNPGGWSMGSERSGGEQYEYPSFEKVRKKTSGLCGRVVDPRKFWFDYDHDFYVEESELTFAELMRGVERGIYDKRQAEKAKRKHANPLNEFLADYKLESPSSNWRQRIKINEYWGDLNDCEGNLVMENARVVVAEDTIVLNPDNMGNPFWHGRPPYVVGGPILNMFRKEGRSIVEDIRGMQRALNNIINWNLDKHLIKMDPPRIVIMDSIDNVDDINNPGPGQIIESNGRHPEPVKEVQVSDIPQGSFKIAELLRYAMQNAHGLTDSVMAAHPSRPGTTATEASIMTAESNDQFEGYSRNIEEQLIEPAIDMVRYLMIQYWRDFDDPALQEIGQKYGLPFDAETDEERIQFLLGSVRVRARGISSWFEKKDRLKSVIDYMNIIGNVEAIAQEADLNELHKRIIEGFGFQDSDELTMTMEKKLRRMEEQMQLQLMQQQMEMQLQEQMQPLAGPPPMPPEPPPGPAMVGQPGLPMPTEEPLAEAPMPQEILAALQGQGGGIA